MFRTESLWHDLFFLQGKIRITLHIHDMDFLFRAMAGLTTWILQKAMLCPLIWHDDYVFVYYNPEPDKAVLTNRDWSSLFV